MDKLVFNDLMDKGIVTMVGLDPEKFTFADLEDYGYATSIYSDEVYNEAVKNLVNVEEVIAKFLEDIKNGGKVVVPMDIELSDYIEIRNDVTIDLNGYKIIHPMSSPSKYSDVFEVMTGGKLTIVGDGEVVAENGYAIYAAGDAVVEINGGSYFSPVSTVDARKNASVTINAGTFKVDGSNNPDGDFGQKYTLNLRDKTGNYASELSEIVVKGGKFYKYNPAASESEPVITNFVANGFESVHEGDWYVVRPVAEVVVDDATE